MATITLMTITSMIITMFMITIYMTISKSNKPNREKMTPFECGFNPKSSARTPFSLQFFLIAILFLIFDIEIAIILPMIITMKVSMTKTWIMTITMFIIILITGLYYEWNNGILEWMK